MKLLGNLIDNAFKWCRTSVVVPAYSKIDQFFIEIKDEDAGIKPELIPSILERGTRTDQLVPGYGIGLAIV